MFAICVDADAFNSKQHQDEQPYETIPYVHIIGYPPGINS